MKILSRTDNFWRYAILTTLGVAIAFLLGESLNLLNGIITAVAAAITIQPTFHKSLREMSWQLVGLTIGFGLALLADGVWGDYQTIILFIGVFLGFATAKLLRVDKGSAVGLVVPIILLVGPATFSVDKVETRALSVLVGGLIGLAISLAVRPGSPQTRAIDNVVEKAEDVAEIVDEVADALPETTISTKQLDDWLLSIDHTQEELALVRQEADDALKNSAWSPLMRKRDLEDIVEQVNATQVTADTVATMLIDLRNLKIKGQVEDEQILPDHIAHALKGVLKGTADTILVQAEQVANGKPASPASEEVVSSAAIVRKETLETVRETEPALTLPTIVSSSLIRDAEKIETVLVDDLIEEESKDEIVIPPKKNKMGKEKQSKKKPKLTRKV